MVKKTYKELLEGLKYSDLGYTGERKPLTDPKYKQFTDTINKNAVIANTHIDSSLPTMPQAQVSGQGTTIPTAKVDGQNPWAKNRRNAGLQDPKGAEVSTVGSETTVGGSTPETVPTTDTPLTIDSKYSDFVKWAKEHGVDSDKVLQDAMALARTQYEQSRATYGLQAEQLAQAGLTNSGVSDNMERVAYAQKVQAEQAALDQKAALDQSNKQAYSAYKEQQRQQYTDLFQKYVFGYEDEFGNIHAPVSPDEAEALLKLAGLNDEAMIADLRKSYDEYKGIGDKKAQEQQFAIAGLDTTTDADGNTTVNGFSADSMFGKLFNGTWDSEDFLDQIQKDYGVRFNSETEAVDALLEEGKITKEQSSMYYRSLFNNALEAVSTVGDNLGSKDSQLYKTIAEANQAYKDGNLSKSDWDAFRKGVLEGKSKVSLSLNEEKTDLFYKFKYTIRIGDNEETITLKSGGPFVIDKGLETTLNNLSDDTNIAHYDGNLYIKNNQGYWYKIDGVLGTKKSNIKGILKLLSQK